MTSQLGKKKKKEDRLNAKVQVRQTQTGVHSPYFTLRQQRARTVRRIHCLSFKAAKGNTIYTCRPGCVPSLGLMRNTQSRIKHRRTISSCVSDMRSKIPHLRWANLPLTEKSDEKRNKDDVVAGDFSSDGDC